ncbi:MAG: metal-dependent transcriptional regulator [Clostridia bacterium]|nr:metal-dependent transcriptional regulator [Clostridia bacterium]
MPIQESGEMYLETIHVLSKNGNSVRSIDVSEYMGYSKPSVSRALGILRNDGYITVDRSGFISLTDTGRERAEKIFERHTIITEFLGMLGVDEETAAEDACKMEHIISDTSFEAIKKFRADKNTQN